MTTSLVLRVGEGSFEHGFQVSLQVLKNGLLIQNFNNCSRLPSAPHLPLAYKEWQQKYRQLGQNSQLGQICQVEPVEEQYTHFSSVEPLQDCQASSNSLKQSLKNWFCSVSFQSLRNQIMAQVKNDDATTSVPVIIDVNTGIPEQDALLRKLPWDLWDVFKHLRNAEPVLSATVHPPIAPLKRPVKILAIFGSDEGGLELQEDLEALKQLQQYGADIQAEIQPNRQALSDLLWDKPWDVLFFAGHSSSQEGHQNGYLQIVGNLTIELDGLEADLERAVEQGLKLAIFNSCDGLGIANYLSDLNVPSMIVMREPVPDLVARKFLRYFLEAFSRGKPLYLAVREARKRLQALETCQPPYPAASWLPIVCQNPAQPELIWPKLFTWKKIALMGVAGVAAVSLIFAIVPSLRNSLFQPSSSPQPSTSPETVSADIAAPADIAARISFGNKNLLPKEDGKNNSKFRYYKEQGIQAMAAGQDTIAVSYFKNALQSNPNAPETLIYLNNARIGNAKAHTLAVVVPAGTNPSNALEMLRGFAQAQNEINMYGGINKVPLKLVIANDDDNEVIAQKIATYLVSQDKILAVTGHWTSDVSLKAARVYVSGKLVFIAPVSTTTKLTNSSDYREYVYQTNINTRQGSRALAAQMLKTWKKQKAAIFYANVTYGLELRSEFEDAVKEGGGEIVAQFNLSDPNFNAAQSVEEAIRDGAEIIFIPTDNKSISEAWKVIKANRNRLKLLGDLANLYSVDTLRECQDAASAMVMANPWHRENNPTFAESAKSLWGGAEVNHITAISYDAVQALIEAMRRNPTREGIKDALEDSNFAFSGATGNQQFSPAGDRKMQPQLIQVQKSNHSRSKTGYDFVLLAS